ncbi:helix-turn-helix transcriptional regulator [Pectobacterium brasiliense]|uniref:Helix-turn-helix transcriptional regulator n=2 Tax=Pectobacteriaceae TaxID=1903410 RepID=A0A9Q2EQ97_9GAMM|nr:helix-turn-helix transcriptional regulator [Pectobacterium quasiaquaticum]MBN3069177.1 helix-turn-helix transcriptional regulator [Pectobacterium brasiliense]MBE5202001.1 helix-turn-helix transcriptional regulator [Pectobacterium quasiaquaticum]MBE5208833.1 helix-turn-helix transcriptional regulator [Pectobacterium quasiaquaticum]MBE5223067.1 helix-turn-helix transcriptional regulator [Pectobacterium quasiaquaticum]MBN3247107.1 helix-turn-helix transcriptional regulator [Pectobacterium bras
MSTTNPIPERLKEARIKAGISQRALGILVGFDPASASSRMNHYEKGRHIPDIDTLRRMASELGVPLNYFFCDDQITAELSLLISKMTPEERIQLIERLKNQSQTVMNIKK